MDYKVDYISFVDLATTEVPLSKETWEQVLYAYEEALKIVAGKPVRQAILELADFKEAVANDISGYTLILQRDREDKTETWNGIFQRGEKLLKVRARLETV